MRLNSRASVSSQSGPSPGRFDGFAPALRVLELVGAEAQLAGLAVDHRVGEPGQVPRRLPDPRVLDDRRVDRDDVVALLQHRAPPLVLDVVLEQHAVVAVVVGRADAAVDLRRGEDEAAPLAQRDDLVEGRAGSTGARGGIGHRRRKLAAVSGASDPLPYSAPHADLRVPLRERPHLRGVPVDVRRPGDRLRGVRRAGRARLPPGGRPLQGLGLLHDRLREEGRRHDGGDDGSKSDGGDSDSKSSDSKSSDSSSKLRVSSNRRTSSKSEPSSQLATSA